MYSIRIEADQQVNERSYFIPRLVNANKNMLFTQLSNTQLRNNRRASKKSRKNKKEQQQQFYESHIKRKSSFNEDPRPNEEEEQILEEQIVNHSNTTLNQTTNEYPSAQIDEKHERELQEVFGIEGARKYQEYQLKQQILNQQHSADVKDLPQKKRDSSLGAAEEIQDVPGSMINQMMSRTTRGQRVYDVPLIRKFFSPIFCFPQIISGKEFAFVMSISNQTHSIRQSTIFSQTKQIRSTRGNA